MRPRHRSLALVVPSVLVGLILWSPAARPFSEELVEGVIPITPGAADDVEAWRRSVVMLVTGSAWCAGVLVDTSGTVATAYHCVASGRRPRVQTLDGRVLTGEIARLRVEDDLALLRVEGLPEILPAATVRVEPLRAGEDLWAIGHPFASAADGGEVFEGLLQWSVSRGIVSAVGPRLVQVDVPLNPGNSGGPVFDGQGRVAGIASRRLDADNVAFVVPSTLLLDLLADEEREKPILGGTWGLGLTTLQGLGLYDVATLGIRMEAAVRDRVLGEIVFSWPLNARWVALESGESRWVGTEGLLSLRARLGTGRWSTTFDLGGGVILESGLEGRILSETLSLAQRPVVLRPAVQGRLSLGGSGLRLLCLPMSATPRLYLGVDLSWPGVLGTF